MKKSRKVFTAILSIFGVASLTACNKGESGESSLNSGNSDKKEKSTIRLQLTPSRPSIDLTANAAALKPILEKYDTKHTYKITVGTSFSSDGLALAAGTIDASFITASVFATSQIANPGKVDRLLRASRDGFKVIEENPDPKDSSNHTNAAARALQVEKRNDASYKYKGDTSGVASYYYAECIISAAKKNELDTNRDGKVTLDELAGKKVGRQGTGSPAGYTYPLYAFSQVTNNGAWAKGRTPVTANADASKGQFISVNAGNYATTFNQLRNGQIDARWGYRDFRKDQKNYKSSKTGGDVFTDTYTVALTQGILNDGLAVRKDLDEESKTAIANAFKDIRTKGGNAHDNGIGTTADTNGCYDINGDGKADDAYAVYSLYSHTGYVDAKNSDYDDEIAFQKWAAANLSSK